MVCYISTTITIVYIITMTMRDSWIKIIVGGLAMFIGYSLFTSGITEIINPTIAIRQEIVDYLYLIKSSNKLQIVLTTVDVSSPACQFRINELIRLWQFNKTDAELLVKYQEFANINVHYPGILELSDEDAIFQKTLQGESPNSKAIRLGDLR